MRDAAVVLICLKCVPPTNTTEVSTASLPPPPTPRPTRQLNPSLCVPHSCMDLSALGRGAALCGGGGAGQ